MAGAEIRVVAVSEKYLLFTHFASVCSGDVDNVRTSAGFDIIIIAYHLHITCVENMQNTVIFNGTS